MSNHNWKSKFSSNPNRRRQAWCKSKKKWLDHEETSALLKLLKKNQDRIVEETLKDKDEKPVDGSAV